MKKTTEEVIHQFGIREQDGEVWIVERPFILEIRLGPGEPVQRGQRVRLGHDFGWYMFYCGKVSPESLENTFEILPGFTTIGNDGNWLDLEKGDIVKLERDEALPLLRQKKIKEKRDFNEG